MENIKYYLVKFGYEDIKDNTLYKNLEFLEKNEFIAGIPLPSMDKPSRPPNCYRLIGTGSLTIGVDAILRCNNDPMYCPDKNCKICYNAGIKTCWD
jgi:hypothetical protein